MGCGGFDQKIAALVAHLQTPGVDRWQAAHARRPAMSGRKVQDAFLHGLSNELTQREDAEAKGYPR